MNNTKINSQIEQNKQTEPAKNFMESFPRYALEVTSDIVLAILLGVTVNQVSNWIGKTFKLPYYGKMIVQLILIILVLYIMKVDSQYLYQSWKGQTSYGIIFTAVFLAVQKNVMVFIENVYIEEE